MTDYSCSWKILDAIYKCAVVILWLSRAFGATGAPTKAHWRLSATWPDGTIRTGHWFLPMPWKFMRKPVYSFRLQGILNITHERFAAPSTAHAVSCEPGTA